MKEYIIITMALILSIFSLVMVLSSEPKYLLDEGKVKSYVRIEVQNANSMMKDYIDKVILGQLADKIDHLDLQMIIEKDKVTKALKRSSKFNSEQFADSSYVDLSGLSTNEEKIDKILGETSWPNRGYVEEIVSIGDRAKPILIEHLNKLDGSDSEDWIKERTIEDALTVLLRKEDKEIIMKLFVEKNLCIELLRKYQFHDAEDTVMKKITYTKERINPDFLNKAIDLALLLNENKAIPILKENALHSDYFWGMFSLRRLAAIPDIDLTDTLINAAKISLNRYHLETVIEIMLQRGMKEGINQTILFLKSSSSGAEYQNQKIADLARKYTGVNGNYNDIAEWLEKNKYNLNWSHDQQKFILSK